ncbi:S16 family serine protease [Verrucomicrobium sp. BvORR106]|uniref:S16 family serine protease n=1 Tax=Verrucomicrobium sp. BvORR106 TaxID=1403819 RepID=UPI000570927E|nr:S16 family serine protease [Verrucomicrobium sp. BvORR106]
MLFRSPFSIPYAPTLALVAVIWGGFHPKSFAQSPSAPLSQAQLDKLPKRLSLLNEMEFTQWLLGTEWEYESDGKVRTLWFVTPTCQIWTEEKGTSIQRSWGYTTTKGTALAYYEASERKGPRLVTINEDLQSATLDSIGKRLPMRLLGRRFPRPLEVSMTLPEFEEWMKARVLQSDNKVWLGEDGYLRWNSDKDKARYSFPAPGLVECEWNNRWNRSLVIVDPNMKTYRWFSGWGTDGGKIESTKRSSPATVATVQGAGPVAIRKRLSSVGGLLVVPLGNSRYAGKTSKLSITALKMEKNDPAIIGFNQEVGEDMSKALKEVCKYQTLRHDGWPRGHKMEIFFEDKYSPKDGPSAAVACALLVESLVLNVELDPGFSVTGDLNADGSVQPIGGVIAKLRGAAKGGQKIAAIPQKNRTSALDLAVGEGATPFVGLQLFSVDTFDEALALARKDRAPALAEALTAFDAVSARIRSSPGLLGTPAIREALGGVVTAAPNHVSARLLLAMAEGRLPGQFSASGSLDAVDQAVATIREATDTDLSATSSLDSGKLSASRNRLQRLRGKVDNRVQPYVDAWITWASLADQMISRRSAPPQVIEQFKAAISRISAEAKKLEGNSEFMEEVLR